MRLYRQDDLIRGAQRVSDTIGTDHKAGSDVFDGTPIFCGISLVLAIVAVWAAASGHVDLSAVMF